MPTTSVEKTFLSLQYSPDEPFLAIVLSRIKLNLEEIRRALLDVDDSKLAPDDLRAISRQLPTPEEVGNTHPFCNTFVEILQITRIRDFEDVGKLAKSDQYFSQVGSVPVPVVWG